MNIDFENYYIDESNQLIDMTTGEIVDREKIKRAYENKITEDRNEYAKELSKMGIVFDISIIKYRGVEYPVVTIKKDYSFRKVFVVDVREVIKELSKNAKVFIATFEPYIYFPHNTIVVDNKHPTIPEMCEMLDLKKSAVYNVLKELENHGVIKKINLNGEIVIYFNPFLYCGGGVVHKDTYKLFEDSIYNPLNKNIK